MLKVKPAMSKTNSIKAGERRDVSILFADLKDFTSLSAQMDPEDMDAIMNRVFGIFEELILARGGVVEKYIGDALVAVFGIDEIHEDNSQRALEAAIAFLERNRALEEVLLSNSNHKNVSLSFRIGLHSGLIATGDRGSFRVVTGHPMAVAQRIQAAAEPDGILVSDTVKERCEGDYDFDGPLRLSVKGAKESILAWRLLGPSENFLRDKGPFIGRKEEQEELLRLYIKHDNKSSLGVYLSGEAGIGKSRLAAALAEGIKAYPGFHSPILTGKGQAFRQHSYGIIADLILEYLGVDQASGPEAIAGLLHTKIGMDKKTGLSFASIFEASNTRPESELVLALFSILSAICGSHAKSPFSVFVFIDNSQSMDRKSVEFLSYYIKNAEYKPFILLAGRESATIAKDCFQDFRQIRLLPFKTEESRMIARAFWRDIPEKLLDSVVSQAGGNPLFIKEYSLYAQKHRDISSLPGTIQNIFLARLDRYGQETRDLAALLSVFVHSFTALEAGRLYEAFGRSGAQLQASLDILHKDGLLVKNAEEYSFGQDLFKKALYGSLLNHNKKLLHGLVAELMLEKKSKNRLRLLYHLTRAERWLLAAELITSDPARNFGYEYHPYIDLLYKRLANTKPDVAIQLLITKSALYFNAGKIARADEELKRVMKSAIGEHNNLCMGFAYHLISANNVMEAAFQKARFTGEKALYYYKRANAAPKSMQNVLRHMAFSELLRNNFEEAEGLIEEMLNIPGFDAYEYAIAKAEYRLYAGDYHGALTLLDKAPKPVEEDYLFVADFFDNDLRLRILWQLCDFAALVPGAKLLLDAGSLSQRSLSQAQAMLAAALAFSGNKDASGAAFMQAEYYADQVHNDYDRIEVLKTLSICHYMAGNMRKAESLAHETLVSGLRHSSYYPVFSVLVLLVELAFGKGRHEEAEFFLAEASYCLATGLHLPDKDAILYYYYSARLDAENKAGSYDGKRVKASIALNLMEAEKARLARPELVSAFLAMRSFGEANEWLLDHSGGE